jgi:hypothetical protein
MRRRDGDGVGMWLSLVDLCMGWEVVGVVSVGNGEFCGYYSSH